jgi:hypothetical protein
MCPVSSEDTICCNLRTIDAAELRLRSYCNDPDIYGKDHTAHSLRSSGTSLILIASTTWGRPIFRFPVGNRTVFWTHCRFRPIPRCSVQDQIQNVAYF